MFKVTCVCGDSEKSFKKNIGPFFVNTCCEKKGYDCRGKLPEDYEREAEELANQLTGEQNETNTDAGSGQTPGDPLTPEQREKMNALQNKVVGNQEPGQTEEVDDIDPEVQALMDGNSSKQLKAILDAKQIKYGTRASKEELAKKVLGK